MARENMTPVSPEVDAMNTGTDETAVATIVTSLPALLPYQAKRLAATALRAEQEENKRKLASVNARLDARNLKGDARIAARVDIANEESDGLPETLLVPCRKVTTTSKNGRKSVRYVPVGTMDVGKASYWTKGGITLAKAASFTVEGIARTIEAGRTLESMTD